MPCHTSINLHDPVSKWSEPWLSRVDSQPEPWDASCDAAADCVMLWNILVMPRMWQIRCTWSNNLVNSAFEHTLHLRLHAWASRHHLMGVTMMMMTMVIVTMTRIASTVKLVIIPMHVTCTDVKQGKMSCKDAPEGWTHWSHSEQGPALPGAPSCPGTAGRSPLGSPTHAPDRQQHLTCMFVCSFD